MFSEYIAGNIIVEFFYIYFFLKARKGILLITQITIWKLQECLSSAWPSAYDWD